MDKKTLKNIISKFQKTGALLRIIFILASLLTLCFLLVNIIYKPFYAYPEIEQIITIISSCALGVFFMFAFSPPRGLQEELILQSAEEIFRPIVIEAINKARKEAVEQNINYLENLIDYKITHITDSVYSNSIKILEEVNPSIIKIVMKAEEFSFDESGNEKNKEALEWFKYLNEYVQRIRGRKYLRVIAIYPRTKQEAESNLKWISRMIEHLKTQKVTNCEIRVVIRDITISCVLLNAKVVFFAFLIDRDFTNFMEVRSKGKDILNRGINDWFDQKFDSQTQKDIYTIFKNGQFNENSFIELQKKVSSYF